MVRSAQAVTQPFTTCSPTTGAAVNADSLPTAVLIIDGVDNAATVTVTNVTTGAYKAAVTLPALTAGQCVALRVSATVAGVAGLGIVWSDLADTSYISDVQSSVSVGVPQNVTASLGTLTTGNNISGDYSSTYLDNATYWTTQPVTPAVNTFYLFQSVTILCGTKRASTVTINGRFQAATARYCHVYAYNYQTSSWDQLTDSSTRMSHSTTDVTYTYSLLAQHQKNTSSGDGEVKIGFGVAVAYNSGDRLYLDQILVAAVAPGTSAAEVAQATYDKLRNTAYGDGVWIDTVGGTAGTAIGVNGISNNPVSTLADAYALCTSMGLKRIYLKPGSSITLTQSAAGWRFIGYGDINLGGQAVDNAVFENCYEVYGTSTGINARFICCGISNENGITVGHSYYQNCMFKGVFTTVDNTGEHDFHILDCSNAVSGGGVTEWVVSSGTNVYLRNWRGGMKVSGLSSGSEVIADGAGRLIIGTTCSGGTINARGQFYVTDDGSFAGTLTENANVPYLLEGVSDTELILMKLLRNRFVVNPSTGVMTLYDDDNTTELFTANLYENPEGTVPFHGGSVQRRNRLT